MTVFDASVRAVATEVVTALRRRGETVATAESLTGGLVVAALTTVPGSSEVVRGGVCAYHPDVKADVVGISREALRHGAVNGRVAEELASGCRRALGADYGLGTTGVAGPDPSDGCSVGTVFIALAEGPDRRVGVIGPDESVGAAGAHPEHTERVMSRALSLEGDRDTIRENTVREVLGMLAEHLAR